MVGARFHKFRAGVGFWEHATDLIARPDVLAYSAAQGAFDLEMGNGGGVFHIPAAAASRQSTLRS